MMAGATEGWPSVRLFVPVALTADIYIDLARDQAHYLTRVMRLASGERIRLFNGRDGEWLGRLATSGRGRVTVQVERQIRDQEPEDGPWLVFAPVKKTATDFIIEKATELGVARILPIITERTIAHRVNLSRLQTIAIEAAEQCGRLTIPDLAEPVNLATLVAAWPAQRCLFVAHPYADDRPLPLLDALMAPDEDEGPDLAVLEETKSAAFLIGPEGGLTRPELDVVAALPCAKVVRLGPRILRAETAAAAVLACWQGVAEARRRDALKP